MTVQASVAKWKMQLSRKIDRKIIYDNLSHMAIFLVKDYIFTNFVTIIIIQSQPKLI